MNHAAADAPIELQPGLAQDSVLIDTQFQFAAGLQIAVDVQLRPGPGVGQRRQVEPLYIEAELVRPTFVPVQERIAPNGNPARCGHGFDAVLKIFR